MRQLALEQNTVIAASFWAKIKTIFQMVMIIFLLVNFSVILDFPFVPEILNALKWILIYITSALTVISAADYIIKNKNIFIMKQ